jgi:hypothetical protein
MLKRFFFSLALALSCALLLTACGGSEAPANNSSTANASNKTATTTTTTTTTSTPATTTSPPAMPPTTTTPSTTTTAGSGERIGVPECDDYLTKYEACVSGKIPEAARAGYTSTLARTREQWRKLAADPQSRPILVQACKMANEQSKTNLKSFGCEF